MTTKLFIISNESIFYNFVRNKKHKKYDLDNNDWLHDNWRNSK